MFLFLVWFPIALDFQKSWKDNTQNPCILITLFSFHADILHYCGKLVTAEKPALENLIN